MALAVDTKYGLTIGNPAIKSVGPITFGPDGILFVADNANATILAIDVGDADTVTEAQPLDMDQLDTRLAAYLGCAREDVVIRDMAVDPRSQEVYFSIMRGSGTAALPLLVKLALDGTLHEVPLEQVPFLQTAIENAPAENDERRAGRDPLRTVTVTDMAYVDGMLLVAGASNEEFSSALRRIPFPFKGEMQSNSLEIFHVSHGRYETASPIRTFMPYRGNTSIVASYTCTPVVHFSLQDVRSGSQVKGRTVAELGAGNTPIDILSYERDGEEYILVSNARHPLMKIATRDIDRQQGLTEPQGPVGVPRDVMPQQGVSRMANLNHSYVLMMQKDEPGNINLKSYSTASL
jgi:hypothetical protein